MNIIQSQLSFLFSRIFNRTIRIILYRTFNFITAMISVLWVFDVKASVVFPFIWDKVLALFIG